MERERTPWFSIATRKHDDSPSQNGRAHCFAGTRETGLPLTESEPCATHQLVAWLPAPGCMEVQVGRTSQPCEVVVPTQKNQQKNAPSFACRR